jgi:hypothetical protein
MMSRYDNAYKVKCGLGYLSKAQNDTCLPSTQPGKKTPFNFSMVIPHVSRCHRGVAPQ